MVILKVDLKIFSKNVHNENRKNFFEIPSFTREITKIRGILVKKINHCRKVPRTSERFESKFSTLPLAENLRCNITIERGRWKKLEIMDRQCSTCFKLEDEYHIIIECSLYVSWRKLYLPKNLCINPCMFKLVKFLDNVKGKELRNFGIYCHKVFKYYSENIL